VTKGHAYGNDFLLVPESQIGKADPVRLAQAMCHRLEGIGADGLMLYTLDKDVARMRLFNADGSPSEVSGNGVRCLAALAVRERPALKTVTIETPAGPKVLELTGKDGDRLTFRASMGEPKDIKLVEFDAAGERVQAVTLSVGNPQCVLLDDALYHTRLHNLGPAIEQHP
jgi:diaminopimelate epimerase